MKTKQDLSFWKLWNLSFGFFGVQIAYALQSANISRIFATLGADPHSLSYFWILPPLMGIIVQPIIGTLSDKTWCRYGRRIPYLFIGAALAVLVMCLLPNAGSFGMTVSTAMMFGLFSLMFLDTSINMAMQPFKMLVGDMVNEKQKGLAYSIQSFLCNAGSLVGYVFPFVFTFLGISNIADKGVVPDSVIYSFYVGAAILILCVVYTTAKVKEMPPKEYAEYHGLLGQFSPSLGLTPDEIEYFGLSFREELFTQPFITDWIVDKIFGKWADEVRKTYLDRTHDDMYKMKSAYDTQRKVEAAFAGKTTDDDKCIRDGLYSLISEVLFVRDHKKAGYFHPRIAVQLDYVFEMLNDNEKAAFNRLYDDYYYERNNQFWYDQAMKKLPTLTQSTRMLACAEDLGMVPACVP